MLPVNGSRIMETFGPVCRLNPPLQLVIGAPDVMLPRVGIKWTERELERLGNWHQDAKAPTEAVIRFLRD